MTIRYAGSLILAEDDNDIREILGGSLGDAFPSSDILTARNGSEALRVLCGVSVDVLLTDVQMPTMDGMTLTRIIRGMLPRGIREEVVDKYFKGDDGRYERFVEAHRQLPIVIVSANYDKDEIRRFCAEHNATFMSKPVDLDRIVAAVDGYFHAAAEHHQHA